MRTSTTIAIEEQQAQAAAEDVFNGEGGANATAAGPTRDPISEAMCPAAVVEAIQRSLLDRRAPGAAQVPGELKCP